MAIKLTRRQKKEIEKLRKRQKATLVMDTVDGVRKRLNSDELKQRRQDIERRIAGIQSGGRVTQSDPRYKRYGPTGDSRTSTQGDGFMDQLRANTGGFAAPRAQSPRVRGRQNFVDQPRLNINQPNRTDLAEERLYEGVSPPQPPYRGGSIPSIFSQFLPGVGTYKQGRLEREMGFSPSLMDSLRLNTGGFPIQGAPIQGARIRPSGLLEDIIGARVTPSGQSGFLSEPISNAVVGLPTTRARPLTGTVGDFRRGIFDQLSMNTNLAQPTIPDVQLTFGRFKPYSPRNLFLDDEVKEFMENENRPANINVTTSPFLPRSTADAITARARGVGRDIYGNPVTFNQEGLLPFFRTNQELNELLAKNTFNMI